MEELCRSEGCREKDRKKEGKRLKNDRQKKRSLEKERTKKRKNRDREFVRLAQKEHRERKGHKKVRRF
jgi:hypothetical protein